MALLEDLKWRAAIKIFDADKKVSDEQLNDLLAAARLAPSSGGLQPYRIIVVTDPAVRAKLREVGYNQAQITDASALIIFAAETKVDEQLVATFIDNVATTRGVDRASLAGFEGMVNGSIKSRTEAENIAWAQKQAYISVGVLTAAAADLKIDACSMEGFSVDGFNEVLGLTEKGLTASVAVAVGYRSDADVYSKAAKVRKPEDQLFIRI
ncbi:NAD(P)H-dependent oxidoreductase [Mucilaginibacter myungsuensis]|uniref:NAD(P)H-dependent oxidoreductase n=1 Tax=Mucilaginibacter myungsuensis TaxID=649104 RepID=A0A929L027_9SPHI|nr:NAD(P)H-dependent oxidoreductase [Mucilaginibacter myungsuensis]MBE9661695.1 NAD(P)H-dependent oxidoreductase [Mucilaginibacter myungsuensis]MDN3597839.1 NAD(P)H-dependent oxidoreductase [Mucilaginibacter myungsuensis]